MISKSILPKICAMLLCICATVTATEPLFKISTVLNLEAKIIVDTSRAGQPISRRLFGKFTEHLGRNIYRGMWAQILHNPGFEDREYFVDRKKLAKKASETNTQPTNPRTEGLAFHWLPQGEGQVTYKLDKDCVNSESSQYMAIKSLKGEAVGIYQKDVCLPLHREKSYQISIYAKSRGIKSISLTILDGEKDLGRVVFDRLSRKWKRYEARLTIAGKVRKGKPLTLTVTTAQTGELWLDQLMIFPADNVHGFDRDVVDYCRRAKLSLLRYPGGNFASWYHWQDGIGPVNKRPIRFNRVWKAPEYNHVGTDEFMAFCEAVGCEPMICVNAGDGTPQEAAQWVQYCNGPIESKFGRLRAQNGHPQPYNIRYWEIGNELYGRWQVGYCSAKEYAQRYPKFVQAMGKVDPTIKFVANGKNASWHGPLLESAPQMVRSFSLHPLIGSRIPVTTDPVLAYEALMAYPTWYCSHLEKLAEQMKQTGVKPCLALTEMQIFTNKSQLPNNSSLSEALFMARHFHTAIRLGGLVELITHSALVNHGGGLRKRFEVVYPNPSWWATHLYSTMQGTIPLGIEVRTPVYNSRVKSVPAVNDAPYVDALALTDADRSVLTLMLINTHPQENIPATITISDWPMPKRLAGRQINGPSFMARNDWKTPDLITIHNIRESAIVNNGQLQYILPPHSVTELVFRR